MFRNPRIPRDLPVKCCADDVVIYPVFEVIEFAERPVGDLLQQRKLAYENRGSFQYFDPDGEGKLRNKILTSYRFFSEAGEEPHAGMFPHRRGSRHNTCRDQ
jgi:hypothetical protein